MSQDGPEKQREQRSAQRADLARRLRGEGEDELASVLEVCGRPMHLTCTCCGAGRTVEIRCKKRWCPVCARSISAARVSKYAGAVARMQWPLFITLTRPNLKKLTLADIRHMRRAFRRMRQRVWWDRHVRGGVASLEVTNTGKGWHPHIHAVIDCKWLSVKVPPPKPFESRTALLARMKQAAAEVGAAWAEALDLPRASVKVKRAYGSRGAEDPRANSAPIAVEVLKYSVKPTDLIECQEPIGDLLRLLGAARLVSSFGTCYGVKLGDEERPYCPPACECGVVGAWMPDSIVDRIAGRPRKYT
jgi:hypothetical protein